MKNLIRYCSISFLLCLCGCAPVQEAGKTLWGSSTRALEKARDKALAQKFYCSQDACYDAALELTDRGQPQVTAPPEDPSLAEREETFVLFLENRRKHFFVVMGIPGSINTTEAGIFFSAMHDNVVEVEISSLSSNAKAWVADAVFAHLSKRFDPAQ